MNPSQITEGHGHSSSQSAAGVRRPRFNLFLFSHKAIRRAMGDYLARLGNGEVAEGELEAVLAYCEHHLELEENFMRPALAARMKGPLSTFDEGHPNHIRYVAEVRALAKNAANAAPQHKSEAVHALYLHFSAFVGENFAHMAEEERVIQPLLERLFTDEELFAIHRQMLASFTPAVRVSSARLMLPALTREERATVIGSAIAGQPREGVLAMLDAMGAVLPPAIHAELLAVAASQGVSQ